MVMIYLELCASYSSSCHRHHLRHPQLHVPCPLWEHVEILTPAATTTGFSDTQCLDVGVRSCKSTRVDLGLSSWVQSVCNTAAARGSWHSQFLWAIAEVIHSRISPFQIILQLWMTMVAVTAGAVRLANHHHQQTNHQLLQASVRSLGFILNYS